MGFGLVYSETDADFLVGATYRLDGDNVRIFFNCHQKENAERKSWSYSISEEYLPRDSFQETLDGKIVKMVQDLTPVNGKRRVYVRQIREGQVGFVSPFSRSLTARLKTEMVRQWQGIQVIDERAALRQLFQTRGIRVKAKEIKDLGIWEAACTDAQMVLDGVYFAEGDAVNVNLDLKDLHGRVLGSAQIAIPRKLIVISLDDPQAVALSQLGDTTGTQQKAGVRILTNLGGDFPLYLEKEKIGFFVQVGKPLYVYVYDINPRGGVTRLFPQDHSSAPLVFQPGRLYPLPDENDPFEFEICSPFGMDLVKALRQHSCPLPIPEISSEVEVKSYDGSARKDGMSRTRAKISWPGRQSSIPGSGGLLSWRGCKK